MFVDLIFFLGCHGCAHLFMISLLCSPLVLKCPSGALLAELFPDLPMSYLDFVQRVSQVLIRIVLSRSVPDGACGGGLQDFPQESGH